MPANTKNERLSLISWTSQDAVPEPDSEISSEDQFILVGLPAIEVVGGESDWRRGMRRESLLFR